MIIDTIIATCEPTGPGKRFAGCDRARVAAREIGELSPEGGPKTPNIDAIAAQAAAAVRSAAASDRQRPLRRLHDVARPAAGEKEDGWSGGSGHPPRS